VRIKKILRYIDNKLEELKYLDISFFIMRYKSLWKTLLVLFLIVVNSEGIYLGFNPGSTFIGYAKPQILIAPGETEVPITFSITNLGNTLYNVSITPLQIFPFYIYKYYNSTDIINIPIWESGQEINVTFLYNINSTALDGIYKISLNINATNVTKTVSFSVPILGYIKISAQSVWGSLNSPLIVANGETNLPLSIILVNEGNVEAYNVSISLNSTYPIKFEQKKIDIGYLPIGQPITTTIYASVYSNASEGLYNIPITINYFYNSNEKTLLSVPINGYENFSISAIWGTESSPITASPGSDNLPLTFIVKNLGDVTTSNVSILLKQTYPLQISQKYVSIGIIPAGEYNLATITASIYSNVTPGIYYIPVVLHYFESNVTQYVPILISSPKISVNILTLPPQVFPGFYDVRVSAIILNYGDGIAENSTVSLASSFPIVSSNNISLGALPTGVPENVTFLINIPNSTLPGNYVLKFYIKYDGGSLVKYYNLTIYPKANIIIVSTYYPKLNPGSSEVPITLTFKNIGNAEAKNIIVRLGTSNVIYPHVSSSNPLAALTASEVFIGNLKPGQETNVTYIVDISGGATHGNYPLAFALIWNQTGSIIPLYETDQVNVTVSPSFLSQLISTNVITIPSLYLIIIIIVLIAIIAIISVRIRRKR